jgi:hypothetical protein
LFTSERPDWDACREICATCGISDPCLADAIKNDEQFFMRGGLTPDERGTRGVRHPPHGTAAGYAWHRRKGTPVCEYCRLAYNEASKVRQVKYKEKKRRLIKSQQAGSSTPEMVSETSLPLTKGDPPTGYEPT